MANAGITISMDTFLALNPNELQVTEGKGQSRAALWGSRPQAHRITKALFFTFLFFCKLLRALQPR